MLEGSRPEFELEPGGEHLEPIADARDRALGRYRLSYQIASGGMATVYLGRVHGAAGFNRPVAIKRIHPHLAKRPEFVAMFLDEARIASRISHPNVCSIFDFGEVDGSYFMAMEYLVGVPLARLIAAVGRRPDVLGSARWRALSARIVADAAEGLHAAHELRDEQGEPLGIVHRDVSPQNVFVTFDGAVKVVDFGIALARDRLQETNTGTLKGKFAYMAPEHAGGEKIDRRADVWGLGVVLWEMLTAERLFKRRNDMETILAIRSGQIPSPSARIEGVPPALDAIVMGALSVDADVRPSTARALGRELLEFVRTEDAPAGLADLAELMEPIFSQEKSEKIDVVRTVLHEAERAGPEAVPTMPIARPDGSRFGSDTASMPAPEDDGTVSGVSLKDPTQPIAAADTLPLAPPSPTEVDRIVPPPRTRSRAGTVIVIATVACVVIGGAAGLWAAGRDAPSVAGRGSGVTPSRTETETEAETEAEAEAEAEAEVAEEAAPTPAGARTATADRPNSTDADRAPRRAATSTARDPRASARTTKLRATPARAPTAPAETGHAHVVTVGGWGDIYVGDRRVGRTPMRVRLPAGRQTLTVRPFGEGPARTVTVDVPANGVVPAVVRLR